MVIFVPEIERLHRTYEALLDAGCYQLEDAHELLYA